MRLIQQIPISRVVGLITPIGLLLLMRGVATAHDYTPNRLVKTPYGIDVYLGSWVDSSFSPVLTKVIADYNTNTAVTLQRIGGSGDWDPNRTTISYNVGNYNDSFGDIKGYAESFTWRDGAYKSCDEGYCDDGDYKILIGHVYINTGATDYALWKATKYYDRRVFTHETGHVLGLNHVSCFAPVSSVMYYGFCYKPKKYPYKIQSHDISDIDAKY